MVDSKSTLLGSNLPSCQVARSKSTSGGMGGQPGSASSNSLGSSSGRMKSPLGGSTGGSLSHTTGSSSSSSLAAAGRSSTGSSSSQLPQQQVSPHCQYPGLSQSTSPYMQGAGSPEQVYYPHHNPAATNMAAMQMAAASGSSSGLLQPAVSSMSSLMASQQMASCQLAGQNSACALSSSTNQGLGYGALSATGSHTNHSSLPSCTYMQNQPSAHSAYPGHMGVMNIAPGAHYPGSLA